MPQVVGSAQYDHYENAKIFSTVQYDRYENAKNTQYRPVVWKCQNIQQRPVRNS